MRPKSFRRRGHAQHDPAEYVPEEQREFWEKRDPIALYEKFLLEEKLLDAKGKKEIEDKITRLLEKEREFAENSPMPPAELASEGFTALGTIATRFRPKWQRPIEEVTAAEMLRRTGVDGRRIWAGEEFGRRKRSYSFWR